MEKWMLPAAALATGLCLILSASIATAPGNAAAQAAVPAGALSQPLDLGTLAEPAEMLYVPVTPCRVVDTRLSHGALTDGENRSYHVAGTAGIAEQGGKADGCGIPAGATSITAILSAVSPAGSGYMQVWAAGSEKPNATLLLYGTSTTGSGAHTPMRSGADTNLSVENHGGPSDLIIDVTGYYAPQMFAAISGGAGTHTSRLLSATLESQGLSPDGHPLWGPTRLQWDRDVTNCLTEVDFGADTPNRKQITTNGAYTEVTAWRGELPSAYNFTIHVTC
jgi:hypothetical protein